MTPGCEVWISDRVQREPSIAGDVLEVGSFDVNGTIRPIFANPRRFPTYVGIDIARGPGVDVMATGHRLPFGSGRFGLAVTLEMLEHDSAFWLTLAECWRILKPGGWLLVTTRAFTFPRHDYPSDYWRFSPEGLATALRFSGFAYADAVEDHADLGVFAAARRMDGDGPAIKCPDPRHSALLPETQVAMLRDRLTALIPFGMTAAADAFTRIEDDRRLLSQLLDEVYRSTPLTDELAARVRAALWESHGGDYAQASTVPRL